MKAKRRFKRSLALGLAITALGAGTAQASVRPDDRAGQLGIGAQATPSASIRPDDRAGTLGVGTDVVSRYLHNHQTAVRPDDRAGIRGVGTQEVAAATATAAVPDVLERYAAAHPYGSGLSSAMGSTIVPRPPDVSDAAEAAKAISLTTSGGFHWGEYGAGVGTGIGFVLLLAGALTITPLVRRQRTQTT
jgi:hypothetical protein